jgi:signal transduction histidine kinase
VALRAFVKLRGGGVVGSSDRADLRQLAGKFAHDVRNPLHAIRLNLHTLRLAMQTGNPLPADELELLFAESEQEVDRIEQQIRALLDSASATTLRED